jgi:hypothetical protein
MILRVPQRISDRLFDASLITIMGLPPKDPHDDDENEEGEEDDDEEDRRARSHQRTGRLLITEDGGGETSGTRPIAKSTAPPSLLLGLMRLGAVLLVIGRLPRAISL